MTPFKLLVLKLSFSLQEAHTDDVIFIFGTQKFLLLKNKIIKIYLNTADGHIVGSRKTLQIFKPISTEDDIFDIAFDIFAQILLLAWRATHDTPRLAR